MSDESDDLRLHVKSLRRYAMALTGNPTEADDLVQETLKRALTYRRAGRPVRNMRAYLFTILHNVRVDSLTYNGRAGTPVPLDEVTVQAHQAPNQDLRLELLQLARALKTLPEGQRQAILLVGLEGLSYQAAADVLGVRIGTIMSRLHRGREALRRAMNGGADEPSAKRLDADGDTGRCA